MTGISNFLEKEYEVVASIRGSSMLRRLIVLPTDHYRQLWPIVEPFHQYV